MITVHPTDGTVDIYQEEEEEGAKLVESISTDLAASQVLIEEEELYLVSGRSLVTSPLLICSHITVSSAAGMPIILAFNGQFKSVHFIKLNHFTFYF